MALTGPIGSDNLDISFRLQNKNHIFDGTSNPLTKIKSNLIASASAFGLIFIGSSKSEIIVLCTADLESSTIIDSSVPIRKIHMPSPVTQLATNCDSSILAVDIKINNIPHIQLYSVASFLCPNIQKLREFRLSADNTSSIQLNWNPVIDSILAICTEKGSLYLYKLKDQGIEFHTIDQSLKAKCCCWSPKGKQIVAGFENGKLIQFNMELKPTRTIECPSGVMSGNVDTIAIQWLSTYQFAVIFLNNVTEESRPVLYIINAPKSGALQYIAYSDVCYNTSEVRPSKFYIQHVQQWGLLLIASANCIDVSFLRIIKNGDIPEWTQEFPNDQFPCELPLTPEKEESFPIGFELDTACSKQLLQEDGSKFPIMPMIHILSTYGVLCSFYLVNTTPSYVDICSPPRPIDLKMKSLFSVNEIILPSIENSRTLSKQTVEKTPVSHSSATTAQNVNIFSNINVASLTSSSTPFTSQSSVFTVSSLPISSITTNQKQETAQQINQATQKSIFQSNPMLDKNVSSKNQPLITIPSSVNNQLTIQSKKDLKENFNKDDLGDDQQVYIKMIHDEIKAFEVELEFIMEKSQSFKVNIGTKDESAKMRRELEELDELKKEAIETIDSLRSEIQTNRLTLTELFSMVYETKSKCDHINDKKTLVMTPNYDRTNKRTLEKLRKMISQSEIQIQISIQLLNNQWANYQETLNKNRKSKMHVPSLEGIYETLTKQQEIIYNLNGKLKVLKAKLGIFDDIRKEKNLKMTIESLSDSIISMSLIDQIQCEKSKMSEKKIKNLRNCLEQWEVVTIKPQRPKLPGLNSEIVIEKKIKALKSMKNFDSKKESPKTNLSQNNSCISLDKENQSVLNPQLPVETFFNLSQKCSPTMVVTSTSISNSSSTLSQNSKNKMPEEKTIPTFSINQLESQQFESNIKKSSVELENKPTTLNSLSTPMIMRVENRNEENTFPKNQSISKVENELKSTSKNSNIGISANFSLTLPSKNPASKEIQKKKEEYKIEESKQSLSTTNETTSFTFSLSGKKDTSNKPVAQASTITFGSVSSSTSDSEKNPFTIRGNQNSSLLSTPFSFSNLNVSTDKTISTATTSSIFGSNTPSFSNFSMNSNNENKFSNTVESISSTSVLSKSTGESKTSNESVIPSLKITTTSTGFSFGLISTTASKESKSSSFSFGKLDGVTSSTQTSLSSIVQTTNIFGTKPIVTTSSIDTISDIKNSTLSTSKICSPDSSKQQENIKTTKSNIFGETSSHIFSGNSLNSAFAANNTLSSASLKEPVVLSSSLSNSTAVCSSSSSSKNSLLNTNSIFVTQVPHIASVTQGNSIFNITIDKNKTQPAIAAAAASPSSSIFGSSLVKPDQTVFGQSGVPATSSSSFKNIFGGSSTDLTVSTTTKSQNFGNIFGGTVISTAKNSNVFGVTSTSSPISNIFAQTQQVPQTQSGTIFGQTSTLNSSTPLFSQNSFSTPSTGASIFGGSASQTISQSPFNSINIFGSNEQQNSQTSIFGGSGNSSFINQTSTGSIFGVSNTSQTHTAPFGSSNIFVQQNTQNQPQPIFGGSATFSNTFAQNTFGTGSIFGQQQQQNQAVFGGSPTFGSPKSNIFSNAASSTQSNEGQSNIFEQLGSQQSGNLFGNLATQQPQQQSGNFSGSAFSSWR